jgi:hypothetical protein
MAAYATSGIHFDIITGRPAEVASCLRRRVSAYTRDHLVRGFKIGITNNPEARFARHAATYDEMIVLYMSQSLDSVSQVECDLIEHNEEVAHNVINGGGGNYGDPPYYLYIVLRNR